jgi:hypothetical protein
MYIIEYVSSPIGSDTPALHIELALGTTVEEAKDQADTHLRAAMAKFGARGYRILGEGNIRVAIGPEKYRETQSS